MFFLSARGWKHCTRGDGGDVVLLWKLVLNKPATGYAHQSTKESL